MVKVSPQDSKEAYQCEECGFHYGNKGLAEKCEAWCGQAQSAFFVLLIARAMIPFLGAGGNTHHDMMQ